MCKACSKPAECETQEQEYNNWKRNNPPTPIDRILIGFIAAADVIIIALLATSLFNWN